MYRWIIWPYKDEMPRPQAPKYCLHWNQWCYFSRGRLCLQRIWSGSIRGRDNSSPRPLLTLLCYNSGEWCISTENLRLLSIYPHTNAPWSFSCQWRHTADQTFNCMQQRKDPLWRQPLILLSQTLDLWQSKYSLAEVAKCVPNVVSPGYWLKKSGLS